MWRITDGAIAPRQTVARYTRPLHRTGIDLTMSGVKPADEIDSFPRRCEVERRIVQLEIERQAFRRRRPASVQRYRLERGSPSEGAPWCDEAQWKARRVAERSRRSSADEG